MADTSQQPEQGQCDVLLHPSTSDDACGKPAAYRYPGYPMKRDTYMRLCSEHGEPFARFSGTEHWSDSAWHKQEGTT